MADYSTSDDAMEGTLMGHAVLLSRSALKAGKVKVLGVVKPRRHAMHRKASVVSPEGGPDVSYLLEDYTPANFYVPDLDHPEKYEYAETPPHLVDADTFDYEGTRYRLHGVDAPENSQTVKLDGQPITGHAIAQKLAEFLAGKNITIESTGVASRGTKGRNRSVGRLFANGQDVGMWETEHGYAEPVPRFSGDEYLLAFKHAKAKHGSYEEPHVWRKAHHKRNQGVNYGGVTPEQEAADPKLKSVMDWMRSKGLKPSSGVNADGTAQ